MKSAHSTRATILLAVGIIVVIWICQLYAGYQEFRNHIPRPVPPLQFVLANAIDVNLTYDTGKYQTGWIGSDGDVKEPEKRFLPQNAEYAGWMRQVSQVSQGEPPSGEYNIIVRIRYEGMRISDRHPAFRYCPQTGVLRDDRPPTFWCRMPQLFVDDVTKAIREDKIKVKDKPQPSL